MADDEYDQGWKKRPAHSTRPPRPSAYYSYGKKPIKSSFITAEFTVDADEVAAKIAEYQLDYPPAAYATKLLSQTPSIHGQVTLRFERYPSAD
jgi:hypothetical protein